MTKLSNVKPANQQWIVDILTEDNHTISFAHKQTILKMLHATSIDEAIAQHTQLNASTIDQIASYLCDAGCIMYKKCSKCGSYLEPYQDIYVLGDDRHFCGACWKQNFTTDEEWLKYCLSCAVFNVDELITEMFPQMVTDVATKLIAKYNLAHQYPALQDLTDDAQRQLIKQMEVEHYHVNPDQLAHGYLRQRMISDLITVMKLDDVQDVLDALEQENCDWMPYYTQA